MDFIWFFLCTLPGITGTCNLGLKDILAEVQTDPQNLLPDSEKLTVPCPTCCIEIPVLPALL